MSFDPTLASPLDRIRLDLGDTETGAELIADETITAMLAYQGDDERKATVALASALIVRFAQQPGAVTLGDGEGRVEWGARLEGWEALIKRLTAELAASDASAARAAGGFKVVRPGRYGEESSGYGEESSEYRRDVGREPW